MNQLYSDEFQHQVIKLFCFDVKFATQFGMSLSPDIFSTAPRQRIFSLVKDLFTKYQREISKDQLMIAINDYLVFNKIKDDENISIAFQSELQQIFEVNIKGKDQFIKDKCVDFSKTKNFQRAMIEAAEMANQGDVESAYGIIERARSQTLGTVDGVDFKDFFDLRKEWHHDSKPENRVPFGFPTVDKILQGGMGKGELHVVMGATNAGKTTLAVNVGAYNVTRTNNVVYHASFETDQSIVAKKYAVRMTGLDYQQVSDPQYNRMFEDELLKYGRDLPLHIASWPPNTENVQVIKSWIARKRSQDPKASPNLIIVDYDDCLQPSGSRKNLELHERGGIIYSDLLNLAKHFECAVLVFAQADTNGIRKQEAGQVLRMSDIAGSRRKIKDADSVITINFPQENIQQGFLYLDKVRHGESKRSVNIGRDLALCSVYEAIEG